MMQVRLLQLWLSTKRAKARRLLPGANAAGKLQPARDGLAAPNHGPGGLSA